MRSNAIDVTETFGSAVVAGDCPVQTPKAAQQETGTAGAVL
jgi:hypothetical protein